MNKEEYYKRLEKTTEKIKTDRCSEDEIANINRQKLYLAEHYIAGLEQENKKYKEVIDKAIEYIRIYRSYQKIDNKDYLKGRDEIGYLDIYQVDELLDILKEVSE